VIHCVASTFPVRCRRCSLTLVALLPFRQATVRATQRPLVQHDPVRLRCATGIRAGSASVLSPVGELIESYGISYHQFADDTQLLVTMKSAPLCRRPSTGSPTAPPQSDDGSYSTDFSSTPASPRWCSWAPLLNFGRSPTSPLSTLLEAVYRSRHNSSLSASSSTHACDLTATRETSPGRVTSTSAPFATCVVLSLTTSPRRWRAVL